MRVFLDANILFSAAKSGGAVRALLRLLLERGHEAVIDAFVLTEARRNLQLKGEQALGVLEALLPHLEVTASAYANSVAARILAWLPEKDRPVLAAAMALRCDVLLTGDRRHFGSPYGRVVNGVRVLSPSLLAAELLG